jgi:uncharacterized membrane protein YcjF (UPF0283 family)
VADPTATRIAAQECERSLSRWRELAELAERGVLAPLAERADEAIMRAAASTDAELFIVPRELASEYAPKDGVCAALRYPLPAPG